MKAEVWHRNIEPGEQLLQFSYWVMIIFGNTAKRSCLELSILCTIETHLESFKHLKKPENTSWILAFPPSSFRPQAANTKKNCEHIFEHDKQERPKGAR